MSDKSRVFNAYLSVSDLNSQFYANHHLKLSRHPSETDTHFVTRLLGFSIICQFHGHFNSVCHGNEPAVAVNNMIDDQYEYKVWLEVGIPNLKHIKRAKRLSEFFVILIHEANDEGLAEMNQLLQNQNVGVNAFFVDMLLVQELAAHLEKRIDWQITLDGDELSVHSHDLTHSGQLLALYQTQNLPTFTSEEVYV
ncbi:YaeQ family protein [Algicola sagamiensis]|uniref:YaeQ family protein n=1 Tax=Algicola sagamiensis TaxID=163869 RepID=UPI00037AD0AC|nr:YaeQ family protein [Algicola sagamiensis]